MIGAGLRRGRRHVFRGFIHQQDRSRMRLIEFATLIDEIRVGRDLAFSSLVRAAGPAVLR